MCSHTLFGNKWGMSLPFVPPWRASPCSNKTLASVVYLKSLFLTDMTGQLVLLNKSLVRHTCFSLLLVWIFTFLLLGFPSVCRSFLPSGVFFQHWFPSWALVPRWLCCVSFSCFCATESFLFFISIIPLAACLLFPCFSVTFHTAQSKLFLKTFRSLCKPFLLTAVLGLHYAW